MPVKEKNLDSDNFFFPFPCRNFFIFIFAQEASFFFIAVRKKNLAIRKKSFGKKNT